MNHKKIEKYYYFVYFQVKFTKIISYQRLNPFIRLFTKIVMDIIEYKLLF